MGRLKSPIIAAIASAALTAGVVGGVAIAQTSNEISACVAESNGNVRIVSPSEECKPNEAATSWSQQGPAGPEGPVGPAGPPGPAGVVTTTPFNGQVAPSIAGGSTNWVFAGPTATVTTTGTQRLTGSAVAVMGLAPGSRPQAADIGLCYRASAGGPTTNFAGSSYTTAHFFGGDMRTYAAAATTAPGAGSWVVGFCVRNGGPSVIDHNDFSNGWVMVT